MQRLQIMTGKDLGLPESVQEIAEVIGRDKALFLIGQLPQCGRRSWRVCFYVPRRIRPNHQLVQWLGWHDAQRLVAEFGGIILQPSNCNQVHRKFRNQTIHRLSGEGMEPGDIAKAVKLSEKQVKRILKDNPPEALQAANDNTAQDRAG